MSFKREINITHATTLGENEMLSKEEMEMFKTQLLQRKIQIQKNLKDTSTELDGMMELELNDDGDYAAATADSIVDGAILVQQREELNEIETALAKIENHTYGVCEMCGEPIGRARLEVKTFARFCITCRQINEKAQR